MADATDTAKPLFETPAGKLRAAHWAKLHEMAGEDAGQKWAFCTDDIAAIDFAIAEIHELEMQINSLRWGRA